MKNKSKRSRWTTADCRRGRGVRWVFPSLCQRENVLSFADVEDLYDIMHIRKCAFVVHMGDRDLVFKRRQKLYVAD
jgi:hypothetical protein